MSLLELRNRSQTPAKTGLKNLRTKQKLTPTDLKKADNWQSPPPNEDGSARYYHLMREFDKMPWYNKAGTAVNDAARTFADAVSFGQLDKLLGPEQERATADSKTRMGYAAIPTEIAGTLASPVTRVVGAGANLLRGGSGLINSLRNFGVTVGEGSALGGIDAAARGQDIQEGAEAGGTIAGAAEATFKHAIPKTGGILANILAKVPYKDLSDIFEVASKSSEGAKAIKDLQAGKAPSALLDAMNKLKIKLESKPVPKTDEIEEALVDVFGKIATTSGHKALDAQDQALVNKLFDKAYTSKVDATTFNRQYLDDLFSYLEETKVPVAAEKSAGGQLVKNVHDAVKKVGSEADPNFKTLMDLLDTKKIAYRVGKSTSTLSPNTRAFDTARDIGLATAFLAGSSALTNPVLLTAILPLLATASPKVAGTVARKAGSTKRVFRKGVPKNTSYGSLGLVPGAVSNENEDRR